MKFYSLDSLYTFGQFKGKTIKEVLDIKISYIDYCIITLNHFCISKQTLENIKQVKPYFYLSEKAKNKLEEKLLTWEINQKPNYNDYNKKLKFYSIDTKLNYGAFNGKSIREIFSTQPSYIDWSLITISHFCISNETLSILQKITPDFKLTEEAEKIRMAKIKVFEDELLQNSIDDDDFEGDDKAGNR